jgi:hypothetical protein
MVVRFIGEGEQEYPEKTTEVTSRIRNSSHNVVSSTPRHEPTREIHTILIRDE